MNLVLQVREGVPLPTGQVAPNVMMTPPIGKDYWFFRVAVSDKQAVVGFPKFSTIGIGFQHEEDWNTNLPYTCETNEIYEHIEHNRLGADKETCLAAIKMIQEAATALQASN